MMKMNLSKRQLITTGFLLLATLVSMQNLYFYLKFDFQFFIIALSCPFVLYVKERNVFSLRYAFLSLLCLAVYPMIKVQSLFFLGYMFFLLFIIESNLGKVNNLPFYLIILLSPFSGFVFQQLGFPIRLELTSISASILQSMSMDASAVGNILYLNDQAFSVDPECMGLKMVSTSFIITLLFLAHFERRSKTSLSFSVIMLVFAWTSILVILSNLSRILLLVLFSSDPGSLSHELIGIICLISYLILPNYYMIRLIFRKYGKTKTVVIPSPKSFSKKYAWLILPGLMVLLYLNQNRVEYRNIEKDPMAEQIELDGFQKDTVKGNVMQFVNDTSMIYIKPSSKFYGADHTPLICWKGSGYKFDHEKIDVVNGKEVYMAHLKSEENDTLYTAWWYDNGPTKTIRQLDWRWRMIKGENDFRLVNVTCTTQSILNQEVEKLLEMNLFEEIQDVQIDITGNIRSEKGNIISIGLQP